ncbi:hypothetical protein CHS0354_039510, partial [Potamilus streckersoni]
MRDSKVILDCDVDGELIIVFSSQMVMKVRRIVGYNNALKKSLQSLIKPYIQYRYSKLSFDTTILYRNPSKLGLNPNFNACVENKNITRSTIKDHETGKEEKEK